MQDHSKNLILLFICWAMYVTLSAQPCTSGTINDYTAITAFGCNNDITVEDASRFKAGDKVLLIQMKGATVDTSNSPAYGSVTNPGFAGNYNFNFVESVIANRIILKYRQPSNYDVTGKVQLVRVPVYNDVTVCNLTCKAWDGKTGGVLAFEVGGRLTLSAAIDVSGKGFRGGQRSLSNPNFTVLDAHMPDYQLPYPSDRGGQKGEGIAEVIKQSGRGKQSNGGGGGNMHNGGGAGGAGAASGGLGGMGCELCWGFKTDAQGIGGNAVPFTGSQLFMGGGGGGGHRNDNNGTNGANGGGIVIIKANRLNGANQRLVASGADVTIPTGNDAAGGGGGGGTVVLQVNQLESALQVDVTGGNGGAILNSRDGTGGGGGGGFVLTSKSLGALLTIQNAGGTAGYNFNSGNNYGAVKGNDGVTITSFSINESSDPPVNLALQVTRPTCNGTNTGTVVVLPAGLEYSLNGSPFQTANRFDSLAAGPYTVSIRFDNARCVKDTFFVLDQPAALSDSVLTIQPQKCLTKGSVSLLGKGGTTPYQYQLVPGGNWSASGSFGNLGAGSYRVFIRDTNNCLFGKDIVVADSGYQLSLKVDSIRHEDCFSKGYIQVTASPGSAPYQFESNGNVNPGGNRFLNVPAGNYLLKATDKNGCESPALPVTVLNRIKTYRDTMVASICSGQRFQVGTQFYNATGNYSILLKAKDNCDSTVYLRLTVNPVFNRLIQAAICEGEAYPVGVKRYTASGNYTDTLKTTNGCDGIIRLQLTVNPKVVNNLQRTLCDGEKLAVNGKTYDQSRPSGQETVKNGSSKGCDSIINVALTFYPKAAFTLTKVLCPGETFLYNGTLYNENNTSGVEVLKGAGFQGCDSFVTVQLDYRPILVAGLTGPATICKGQPAQLRLQLQGGSQYDVAISDGANPPQLVRNARDGQTITVFPTKTTTFSIVSVSSVTPVCSTVINKPWKVQVESISVLFPEVSNYNGVSVRCKGSDDGSVRADALNGSPPYAFAWSNGSAGPALYNLRAGVYRVTVTSNSGCETSDSIRLTEPGDLTAVAGSLPAGCIDPRGVISLSQAAGGTPPYKVSLNGRDFFPVRESVTRYTGQLPGSYTLSLRDANGCLQDFPVTVDSLTGRTLKIGKDTTITYGDSLLLQPVLNFFPARVRWIPSGEVRCDTCLNTFAKPTAAFVQYKLTVFDSLGCIAADQILVRVLRPYHYFAPNVFHPESQNPANKVFRIFTNEAVSSIEYLRVFDRWGNLVYEARDFTPGTNSPGWDGAVGGKLPDPGVFIYTAALRLYDGTTDVIQGEVLLIR